MLRPQDFYWFSINCIDSSIASGTVLVMSYTDSLIHMIFGSTREQLENRRGNNMWSSTRLVSIFIYSPLHPPTSPPPALRQL